MSVIEVVKHRLSVITNVSGDVATEFTILIVFLI